jgi:hypothetical protein
LRGVEQGDKKILQMTGDVSYSEALEGIRMEQDEKIQQGSNSNRRCTRCARYEPPQEREKRESTIQEKDRDDTDSEVSAWEARK